MSINSKLIGLVAKEYDVDFGTASYLLLKYIEMRELVAKFEQEGEKAFIKIN